MLKGQKLITDKALLDRLRSLAAHPQVIYTCGMIPADLRQCLGRRFGTWQKAVEKIGRTPGRSMGSILPGPNREKVLNLLADGKSQSEVAKELGISRQRVHQITRLSERIQA